jgi:adenylate kinase
MSRIGITGNPGVGKHTITNLLTEKIKDSKIVDINKIIISNRTFNFETSEADLKKTRELLKELVNSNENLIVVGHLLPYVLKKNELDFIVILRRSPYSLLETYKERKYSAKKIHENIVSEILGICFYDALRTFVTNKISEIDTTHINPVDSVKKIIYTYDYKSERQIGIIDWLDLIYKNGDAKRFLM